MSYYRPQPLLPTRSPSYYPPRPQPKFRAPIYRPRQTNWCTMYIRMLEQNPRLMKIIRHRPDIMAMFRNRCGGFAIGAALTRRYYKPKPKPGLILPRPGNTLPPYPQPNYPRPGPQQGGCGYGKRFDSCGCRCVPKDAITPQCIRDCTQCAVDQVFNWCTLSCVPINSKIKQCPPLNLPSPY